MAQYNQRNPAVKRLMKEAQELRDATEDYFAQPLEDNLFEWHFTVRGPPDSDYDGGIYHGRILLPSEYPMKPPNIIIMTPNGRFETNKKICLSISGHHPETWQPSWSLRTALLALIGFMPSQGEGAIGSLDCPSEERKRMARKSWAFKCMHCGLTKLLLKEQATPGHSKTNEEARQLAAQMSFTPESTKQGESRPSSDGVLLANTEDSTVDVDELVQPLAEVDVRYRLSSADTATQPIVQRQQTTPVLTTVIPSSGTRLLTQQASVARAYYNMCIGIIMLICVAMFLLLFIRRASFTIL